MGMVKLGGLMKTNGHPTTKRFVEKKLPFLVRIMVYTTKFAIQVAGLAPQTPQTCQSPRHRGQMVEVSITGATALN